MKFAKVFQQALQDEHIPEEWVSYAIQYKALKKCISKVVVELEQLGLEKDTLHVLLAYQQSPSDNTQSSTSSSSASNTNRPAIVYSFEGTMIEFVPKITVTIDSNNLPVAAQLSPSTREKLKKITESHTSNVKIIEVSAEGSDIGRSPSPEAVDKDSKESIQSVDDLDPTLASLKLDETNGGTYQPVETTHHSDHLPLQRKVEITLKHDSEFFHMLTSELADLDEFKEEQEHYLKEEAEQLARSVSDVVSPNHRRNDMYVWREIFKSYLEAGVFFSNLEQDHGSRDPEKARKNLEWFSKRIDELDLAKNFRNPRSKTLYADFCTINNELLTTLQFQSMNQLALTKILKKFDKQTALSASEAFPNFLADDPFLSVPFAKTVCYIMAERLLTVVPQLDDYLCPICTSISFKPIRLDCGHVFCVRCLVKLQRANEDRCPICRRQVVLEADEHNLDMSRYRYLQTYFPREVKLKQTETENEIAKEQFQSLAGTGKCIIM